MIHRHPSILDQPLYITTTASLRLSPHQVDLFLFFPSADNAIHEQLKCRTNITFPTDSQHPETARKITSKHEIYRHKHPANIRMLTFLSTINYSLSGRKSFKFACVHFTSVIDLCCWHLYAFSVLVLLLDVFFGGGGYFEIVGLFYCPVLFFKACHTLSGLTTLVALWYAVNSIRWMTVARKVEADFESKMEKGYKSQRLSLVFEYTYLRTYALSHTPYSLTHTDRQTNRQTDTLSHECRFPTVSF